MDEIEPDGGKGKGKMVDYDFYDDDISAQDKLYAYEHIIRESSVENLPTHDLPPPAEMTEAPARKHWQQTLTSTTSEPLPAPASPAKAATKAAKKSAAKKPKKEKAAPSPSKAKAAQVPRAVALNKASTPSPAKSPAKAKLAKKASARIAVSVRI